ncbi:putative transmembrane protein [Rhodopirellula islandica]|uniref:Transmembrane protein n=1 Tax=Rhodopirellula islandica TaxID=595434 RepID=A0A0J1EFP0_RHOIS|nr:hypothetical protein [Rhodopirellula islandica]KLU04329.1 putative transmembrane protein [Rhodopirellula islandica]
MKIHPHDCFDCLNPHSDGAADASRRSLASRLIPRKTLGILAGCLFACFLLGGLATAVCNEIQAWGADSIEPKTNGPADRLIAQTVQRIGHGPAFDAKVRQRVWVSGREILGVGTYEQAGQGTGQFNLQVTMLDGEGKHTLQQVSDGRLAWTREQIGEQVSLRRVDVGRLDQWVNDSLASLMGRGSQGAAVPTTMKPSVRVGGWTEMMDTIASEHDLTLQSGQLEGRDVWIVKGTLRDDLRAQRLEEFGTTSWPELCPTQVVVLIARNNDPETDFGKGLPLRIEYWGDPAHQPASENDDESSAAGQQDPSGQPSSQQDSRASETSVVDDSTSVPRTSSQRMQNCPLISLIELYSLRPISPPPIGRFRFENQDLDVEFTNETDRYLSRYGIAITERQSRMLRR